jgi:predicted metalloprotease with PDZ domain
MERGIREAKKEGGMIRTVRFRSVAALAVVAALALLASAARVAAQTHPAPIRIYADLSEAPRRIFHAHMVFPVSPGPLTLEYPDWIPGEHGPNGPIADVVGVRFMALGKIVPWQRDDVDLFAFHVNVPDGASELDVSLDYLTPLESVGYSEGPSATAKMAILEWNLLVLYPQGAKSDDLTYVPILRLPDGWKYATALELAQETDDGSAEFKPVSLTTLVDSPVLAGEYFRSIPLATDIQPPHRLDLAGDSRDAVNIPKDELEAYNRLIHEATALFAGAHHYNHYDFLYSLTDHMDPNGLEHHQSSDNRAPERALLDPESRIYYADLLSHEFFHSWNGKFRRPAGLATPDYQQPMRDDLLWVYEGLTQYYGEVLSERSGLQSAEDYRELLAWNAAYLDNWPGRTWRTLEDTAVSAPLLYMISGHAWRSYRRWIDFYDEGWMMWLEADVTIRQLTHGQKSLDDFCRLFYGAPSTPPEIVPYTLDDVVAALNQVAPYDWAKFFHDRLDVITPHPPMGGIIGGGWHLVYNDQPNIYIQSMEPSENLVAESFTLGVVIGSDQSVKSGELLDVIPGGPAAQAGLAPGMRIIAVNGRAWSSEVLRDAITAAKGTAEPIVLQVDNVGYSSTVRVHYHAGLRYPHLERDPTAPDILSQTLQPLAPQK